MSTINWFELPARDTARAREFYGSLFGWVTNEFDGDYHLIQGSNPAGAIAPKTDELSQPRIYFATDDIDAAVVQVRELGGAADDVVSIPIGRIAHCQDDQGTRFSLYQPAQGA
jgi:predicted enzyme related to lactoylglutathione lyase